MLMEKVGPTLSQDIDRRDSLRCLPLALLPREFYGSICFLTKLSIQVRCCKFVAFFTLIGYLAEDTLRQLYFVFCVFGDCLVRTFLTVYVVREFETAFLF